MAEQATGDAGELEPMLRTRLIKPLHKALARLHGAGAERDKAGNRKLFYDQYLSLLLLYFFGMVQIRALSGSKFEGADWSPCRPIPLLRMMFR